MKAAAFIIGGLFLLGVCCLAERLILGREVDHRDREVEKYYDPDPDDK